MLDKKFITKCNEVLNTLPQDGSAIRYNKLLLTIHKQNKDEKMSNTTLVRCLRRLEFIGVIESIQSTSDKRVVEYRKINHLLPKFYGLSTSIQQLRDFAIECKNENIDDIRFIHLTQHLDILINSIVDELYSYSKADNTKKAESHLDFYITSVLTPYLFEIFDLVRPPLSLEDKNYRRLQEWYSLTEEKKKLFPTPLITINRKELLEKQKEKQKSD